MSTTIRISRENKNKLENIGSKGQSFEDIIMALYHQRNILAIHEICKEMKPLTHNGEPLSKVTIMQVFNSIGYDIPEAPMTPNLKGETWYTNTDYNTAQMNYKNHIYEMAFDEDLVGSDVAHGYRPLPVAEAITNIYCLFENIPAPTWSMSLRMKNPFINYPLKFK